MEGWIKLHRKFQNWEWYTTPNMAHLYVYLLLSANHKDSRFRGIKIARGTTHSSLTKIKAATGLSLRSIRTCLERLKTTGEVTVQTTNRYSIITLCNYDIYNPITNNSDTPTDTPDVNETTNKRQQTRIYKNEEKIRKKKAEIFEKNLEDVELRREKETEQFIKELMSGELD